VLSRRRADDEAGFTVVELMITVMISMIVMSSLLGLLTSQTKAEKRVHDVANSQEAIRLAYVELTSDLRSADPLVAATASSIEVELRALDGTARRLRWSVEPDTAGGLELVRTEIATDGTETSSYRLPGVASADVFTFFKAGITPVEVPAGDEPGCAKRAAVVLLATAEGEGAPLRLESDVDLRNAKVSALC
jgi:Tfp pilus assembly protein PilW